MLKADHYGMIERIKSFLKLIYYFLITLPRDIKGLILMQYVEWRFRKYEREGVTTPMLFERLVKTQPKKPCIIFDDEIWTFQDVEDYTNKVANLFQEKYNLKKGDCVSLFMENRPEYICIWLGLSKLGVISALINTNLKAQMLVHSINISNPKVVVYSHELSESINQIKNELNSDLRYIVHSCPSTKQTDDARLETILLNSSKDRPIISDPIKPSDIIMYIFTSGTTGLPKPAVIKHSRYFAGGITFFEAARLTKNDTIYVCLPIYHANGGIIGIGCGIVSGATIVLRRKFSATNFWKECIQFKCTAMMYVGEVCRYLVNQPPSPYDKQHNVKVAIGNGLRANVWIEFRKRFNVKPVEFYAASEGNCTLINLTSKSGACGFVPVLNHIMKALPVEIIKIDSEMRPIRDSYGFCIRCGPYEKGLVVGLIGNTVKTAYNGYANNKKASDTKILTDVFKKGQKAFNSGDLMSRDDYGYIYFCDRLGDTFRWRGENVATIEVENIMSKILDCAEVVVYGVEVAEQEGRAGMATIISQNEIDMKDFSSKVKDSLTTFARPIFLRLVDSVEHTGSFKAKKNKLVEEAYNMNLVADRMFYFNLKEQQYVPLTRQVYADICSAKMKV